MEQRPHLVTDGAAHLQRRPFPSRGTAAKVGKHGAQENGGQQQNGKALAQMHRVDDIVGALSLGFCELVEANDHQARQWQAPQKPRVSPPQLRGFFHTDVERRAHSPAHRARHRRHRQPLGQCLDIKADMVPLRPQPVGRCARLSVPDRRLL